MKILVTGASGFVGGHLVKSLLNSGHKQEDIIAIYRNNKIENGWPCDLTNINSVKYLIDKTKPDVIIHAAAIPIPKHPEAVGDMLNDNVLTTLNLLEAAPENSKFIFISSILVYGDKHPWLIPTSLYGATKLASEELITPYTTLKGIDKRVIRPCAIVGPDTTHGLLFDIRRKLKSDSPELELFGDEPGTSKPFVHIDDVVMAIKAQIKTTKEELDIQFIENTLDIGPDGCVSVKEIAEAAMEILNIHKPIKWLGAGTIWKGDNKKLQYSEYNFNRILTKPSIEAIKDAFRCNN